MKKFFLNLSLKNRMIFLYTLFAAILMTIITFYVYHFVADLLKEKEASILQDSLEYLEKTLSARIESVNEEYIGLFDDEKFWKLYLECTKQNKDKAEQIRIFNEFQGYIIDMKLRNHDIVDSIYLYSSDGQIYSSEYDYQADYEEFKKSSYYQSCMENKNKILFQSASNEEDTFHIIRSFYFESNASGETAYQSVGYLSEDNEDYSVLDFALKKKYLQKVIREEAEKRETAILIMDETGNIVVQEGDLNWMGESEREALLQQVSGKAQEGYEGKYEQDRVGIHMRQMELTDWSIVYLYDMNILYRQAGRMQKVAFLLFAVAVVSVFLIASFISGTVTKPIRALAQSMDEAIENNMEVGFTTKYNDEVAYLGRRFKELMNRVASLLAEVKRVERQKHVEQSKALQAQINPHFLYNTLDMVYWMAKMEKQDHIANLIADLADFFRLSLNKGEDITTVRKEVDHVQKYMEIQRVRMDEKFDYEICVEPGLEDCRVPKLILQPFVENVLLHGFEALTEKGHIRIAVKRWEDNILFSVEDNGKGIEKELLERLNRGEAASEKANESHGYAIGNVRDRICLYSGRENGVWFDDGMEVGTRVEILFPYGFVEEVADDKDDGSGR